MTPRSRFFLFLSLCLLCLLAAGGLTLGQVLRYNHSLAAFPAASTIGGIPVGGLDAHAAGQRLEQAYAATPVELRIDGQPVHIAPLEAGLELDLAAMLAAASAGQPSYWPGFWDYLWNRAAAAAQVPLACSVSSERLHAYLQEQIAPRYQTLPQPAQPIPGDERFQPGQPGQTLDLQPAEPALSAALCARAPRVVELTSSLTQAPGPTVDSLAAVLKTLTQVSGFDGVAEVYYQDLRTGQEISFAYNQGHEIAADIAFTGASTIKIPVMISAYARTDAMSDELRRRMALMIDLSDNGSTDEVMQTALDPNLGPLQVTQDMRALGLQNTFLAGFFYEGAPLLDRYETPANRRTDITTAPDIYNQTTAADMGRLLAAIQRCAADGNGPLVETFQGKITQAECQEMTDLLRQNRKGVLLEAGLPEGTLLAHKYGWVTDYTDGLLHTTSDAAIVYTPGGDFVFTIYLYDPRQLPWDTVQRMVVARLANAVYNFYNGWK